MKVEYGILPNFNLSIGLGFFDGIHLAHQKIVENTILCARENNLKSAIITFEKSPIELLSLDKKFQYITDNSKKIEIFEDLGLDYLYLLDFDLIKQYSARKYIEILSENFAPKFITTGFNNHFGKDKMGDAKMLSELQGEFGYKYFQIPPQKIDNHLISSTRIKDFISNGDLRSAKEFLGRNFEIKGVVQKGNRLGRKIGFPTANLLWAENIVKLPYGVYFGNAKYNDNSYKALINWGMRPTIDESEILEVHLLGFGEEIYGENLEVEFIEKIREQVKFDNLEELKEQISKDYIKIQLSR